MQLKNFTISGLFGRSGSSDIDFPIPSEDGDTPSVLMLHGRNGVGKTTILRMLNGLLSLDFNIFRQVPFDRCTLTFESGKRLDVEPVRDKQLTSLAVSYGDLRVALHPEHSGPLLDDNRPQVDEFRGEFLKDTDSINFEF